MVKRIDFKDTDKKYELEIYGETFEINEQVIGKIDLEELQKKEPSDTEIEELIEGIFGEGTVEKLNKIRKDNGYKEMELSNEMAIIMAAFEVYIDAIITPIEKASYRSNNNYQNRNYRRNNYHRNKYRRY